MKKIYLVIPLFCCFMLSASIAECQTQLKRGGKKNGYAGRKPSKTSSFLDTQWWLGLKTGINLTDAVSETPYAVFSPINYSAEGLEKQYNSYNKVGMQAGIEVTFYHKGFSFSLQPNFRRLRFEYLNNYRWVNTEIADQELTLNYTQEVSLDYIDIPFYLKYDILRYAKVRPFVEVGAYYGMLAGAEKSVVVKGQDKASGGTNEFDGESMNVGADELFIKSSAGVLGGVGINYDLWKIRVSLDVVYRYGLHNVSDAKNRYANNSLSGIGDTMDDLSLNNISVNMGFLFPLRFISKNFNAVE